VTCFFLITQKIQKKYSSPATRDPRAHTHTNGPKKTENKKGLMVFREEEKNADFFVRVSQRGVSNK
jgi:hypothetical protein